MPLTPYCQMSASSNPVFLKGMVCWYRHLYRLKLSFTRPVFLPLKFAQMSQNDFLITTVGLLLSFCHLGFSVTESSESESRSRHRSRRRLRSRHLNQSRRRRRHRHQSLHQDETGIQVFKVFGNKAHKRSEMSIVIWCLDAWQLVGGRNTSMVVHPSTKRPVP